MFEVSTKYTRTKSMAIAQKIKIKIARRVIKEGDCIIVTYKRSYTNEYQPNNKNWPT